LACVPRGSFEVGLRGESIERRAGEKPIVLRNLTTSIVAPALGAFKTWDRKAGSRKKGRTPAVTKIRRPDFSTSVFAFFFQLLAEKRRVETRRNVT
jgi:hypothetical protein